MKTISLFCGIAGYDRAVLATGGKIVAAADTGAGVAEIYPINQPKNADFLPVHPKQIPISRLPKVVDLVVIGPKRRARTKDDVGKPGSMFDDHDKESWGAALDLIEKIRPRVVVVDADPMIKNSAGNAVLMGRLRTMRYEVHRNTLDGANWGDEAKRSRYFVIAFREASDYRWPTHAIRRVAVREVLLDPFHPEWAKLMNSDFSSPGGQKKAIENMNEMTKGLYMKPEGLQRLLGSMVARHDEMRARIFANDLLNGGAVKMGDFALIMDRCSNCQCTVLPHEMKRVQMGIKAEHEYRAPLQMTCSRPLCSTFNMGGASFANIQEIGDHLDREGFPGDPNGYTRALTLQSARHFTSIRRLSALEYANLQEFGLDTALPKDNEKALDLIGATTPAPLASGIVRSVERALKKQSKGTIYKRTLYEDMSEVTTKPVRVKFEQSVTVCV